MMANLILLIWLHFGADFIAQTDSMALNKSKSNWWLLAHASAYSLPFLWWGVPFALATGAAHFCVDWITSRGTSRLWAKEERHWFFVLIGFDQALHLTVLVLAFKYMV